MKKKMIIFFFFLPFMLGTIGYYTENVDFLDALYGSFALYMVNPVLDEKNILVEVARWLAPVTLASGLILAVKEWGETLKKRICSLKRNTIVIYGNEENKNILKNIIPNAIMANDDETYNTREIIIAFSDDETSLDFCSKNSERLKGRVVYVKIEKAEPQYIDKKGMKFYNINEIIAREYWKKRNLINFYKSRKLKLNIAIIGEGDMAVHILEKALLNNVYSLEQQFIYHIWRSDRLYENLHRDFEPRNNDEIIYHHGDIKEDINMMCQMDRIIVCDNVERNLLTAILELCTENEIDYLGGGSEFIAALYDNKNIKVIDAYKEYITDENIRTKKLYDAAMLLNHQYERKYVTPTTTEEEWDGLSNFLKYSNVAATDYHDIRLLVMQADNSDGIDERMNELEHIRWCRFYFINHWKYGKGENGKKDASKRLHPCLVGYSELSAEDKAKDRETIELLLEIKNAAD